MSFSAELKDFTAGFSTGFHLRDKSKDRQDKKDYYDNKAHGVGNNADREAADAIMSGQPAVDSSPKGARGLKDVDTSQYTADIDDPDAARILGFVRSKEAGGKDPYNTVLGGKTADLTNMTIADVQQYQKQMIASGKESSAVGAYQFIMPTLDATVKQLGLDPTKTKFTSQIQDQLGFQLLKNRGYDRYKAGDPKMPADKFMHNLSQEWASLPADQSGKSFYDGVGSNRSGTDWGTFATILKPAPVAPQATQQAIPAPAPNSQALGVRPGFTQSADGASTYSDGSDNPYSPNYVGPGADEDPEEEPVQGYAAGGAVVPDNMRVSTQAVAQDTAGAPGPSTWTPRRVGSPSPGAPAAALPAPGTAQAKFRAAVAASQQPAAAAPTAAAAQPKPQDMESYLAAKRTFDAGQRAGLQKLETARQMNLSKDEVQAGGQRSVYPQQQQPFMGYEQWAHNQQQWTPGGVNGIPYTPAPAASQALPTGSAMFAPASDPYAARRAQITAASRASMGFAEGGAVKDAPDEAVPTGAMVAPKDYGTLDRGGGGYNEATAPQWRIDAGQRRKAAERLVERDKAYTAVPKAKPVKENRQDATKSEPPVAPTVEAPEGTPPEVQGPPMSAMTPPATAGVGQAPGGGQAPLVSPTWDQTAQKPIPLPQSAQTALPTPPRPLGTGSPAQTTPEVDAMGNPTGGEQVVAPAVAPEQGPPIEAKQEAIPTSIPTPPPRPLEAPGSGAAVAGVAAGASAAADTPAERKPLVEKGQRATTRPAVVKPEEAKESTAAGLKAVQAQLTPPRTSAIGTDPGASQATYAFANNAGALSNEQYKQLAQQVDPEGKLPAAERTLKIQSDLYDFYMARGYPQKAAEAAGSVLMYGRRVSQLSGVMAQAAVEAGDLRAAGDWMAKAYDTLPDGKELRIGEQTTENGQPAIRYQVVDLDSGKVETDDTATADDMHTMAKGMASGAVWAKETLGVATGAARQYKRGAGGSSATEERRQGGSKILTQINDLGEKIKASTDPAEKAKLVDQYNQLEGNYEETVGTRGPLNAARKRWGIDPAKETKGSLAAATEQEHQQKLQTYDADIAAATDPAQKKTLTREKTSYMTDRAFDQAAAANKGVVRTTGLGDTNPMDPDKEIDPADAKAVKTLGGEFLRANKFDADYANQVLFGALDPANALAGPTPDGKVTIGSLGSFLINSKMLEQITAIRKAKRDANKPAS